MQDLVVCRYCGMVFDYQQEALPIYYCESCGKFFCRGCFENLLGQETWIRNFGESSKLLCPECWQKKRGEYSL